MEFQYELIIALIAGFMIGCFVTTLISILLYSSHQKKLEHKMQNRHSIINSIGTLYANIENAFSAYKIGTMKYHTLREVIIAKTNGINTALQGNIDILDPFYVKNIEKFLDEQNKFLLREEKETEVAAKVEAGKDEAVSPLTSEQPYAKKDTIQDTFVDVIDTPKTRVETDEDGSEVSVSEASLVSEDFELTEKKSEETDEPKPDESIKEKVESAAEEEEEFVITEKKSEETDEPKPDESIKEKVESAAEEEEFVIPEKKSAETVEPKPVESIKEKVESAAEEEEFVIPEKKSEETVEPKPVESTKEQVKEDSVERDELLSSIESQATATMSLDQVEELIQPSAETKVTDTTDEAPVQTEEEYFEPAGDEGKDEVEDQYVFEKQVEPESQKSISIEEYPVPDEEKKAEKEDDGQKPEAIYQESFSLFDSKETTTSGESDTISADPQFSEVESDEESGFDIESARFDDTFPSITSETDEEEEPVKGSPVFDSSFDMEPTHFDVEATQLYNVEDLLKKSRDESEASKPTQSIESIGKEEKISDQASKYSTQDEDVFELDIQNESTSQENTFKKGNKKSRSDSLITGNDVMDKMDDFFGFDND